MTAPQGSAGVEVALAQPVKPERVRVLHLVWRLSKGGGIPTVVRALARGLDRERFDLHVASVRPALAEDELDELGSGADIHPLGAAGALSMTDRARTVFAFGRCVRRERPHVVHLHSGTAVYGVLGTLIGRGARVVLDVHAAPGNDQHRRRTEWLEAKLCRHLGWIPLVHSTSVRDETARSYRLPSTEVHLVPLGIETRRFGAPAVDKGDWRRTHALPTEAVVGLYVARLVAPKNLDRLIDVAMILRETDAEDVVVAIVGDGPERNRLEDRVRRAGLDEAVRFLGPLYGQDLVDAYHGCDIFVSCSDYESFGLTLVEAMAAGMPVVATAVGGVVDIVDDGRTGALVARDSASELASAVRALVDDPSRRERLGRAAVERARTHFDVAAMVAGYARLYEHAVDGPVDVFLLKSPDFSAWAHEAGTTGLPYGIEHLSGPAVRLRWSDATYRFPWSSPPVRRALRAASRGGPPFLQTLLNAHHIAHSPVTLAMFESEGNFLAWLRRLGVPGTGATRLMVISCWLAELLPTFSPRRLAWYQRTYAMVDRLLFFSSNQFDIFERLLGLPRQRLCFVPFGVDHELFRPSAADEGFVLAVGRDRGRDWPTFLAAMERNKLPAKVLCRPRDVAGLAVPANVEVLGYVDRRSYRQLLASARVSVVTSREVAYPAGQSVALESMAVKKCCVVTGTESLRDYVEAGVNAIVVPPGDPQALADTISLAYEDGQERARIGAGGRRAVEERFNAQAMWRQIGDEIASMVR